MGSYKWGHKSPNVGYNYSYPTYRVSTRTPPPQTPLIESLWPLIVGIWGFSEDSWGSRKFGVRVANFGAVIKGCWR